jgi:PAS domain S-box-containing protein
MAGLLVMPNIRQWLPYAGETVQGIIMVLDRPDDSTRWVSASSAPVIGRDGKVQGAISTNSDSTPLHEAQVQYEQASQELDLVAEELRVQNEELSDLSEFSHAKRDRMAALLLNIPDEVWFCDATGNLIAANPTAVRGLGLAKSGEIYHPVPEWTSLEIYEPDGRLRSLNQAPMLRALRGEVVSNQEEVIRHPVTGEMRYRLGSAALLRDRAGQIIGAVGLPRDITHLKSMEAELRRNEPTYGAIAHHFPDGAVYVFDRDLRYLVVDGELLPALDQSPEVMEGKTTQRRETMGLLSMRKRAEVLGGSLTIESSLGQGTTVYVEAPLD